MRTLAVLALSAAAVFGAAGSALADDSDSKTSTDNNSKKCHADHAINVLSCNDVLNDVINLQGIL